MVAAHNMTWNLQWKHHNKQDHCAYYLAPVCYMSLMVQEAKLKYNEHYIIFGWTT